MQKILSVCFAVNDSGLAKNNKSLTVVNEYLRAGWKVEKIVCSTENLNGVIGAFIVLEKEDQNA